MNEIIGKLPPKWMQALSHGLNLAGATITAAGAGGVGLENVAPDGTVDVSTWPTLATGVVVLLAGMLTGQNNVAKAASAVSAAAAAPPVGPEGQCSSSLTLGVALRQAWDEGNKARVGKIAELLEEKKS